MIRNHFTMLPERAFQPRGPYGMTLESFIAEAVEWVGETVSDAGSAIDDFVNEEIPGGWITVAAVVAATTGVPLPPGSETAATATAAETAAATTAASSAGTAAGLGAADAITAAEWFGGTGAATAPGATFGSTAATAAVPSAFETAINTVPTTAPTTPLGPTTELGSFGSTGTAGFGTALPPAADVTAALTAAGFAPGTAANLAGETAAGVGATNLLGGATATAPLTVPQTLSIQEAIRGAQLANQLLTPQQQAIPNQIGTNVPQGAIDYSGLLGLLAQRARGTGLLGTRFQPQPVNLTSLLG